MKLFYPAKIYGSIYDIDYIKLYKDGIRGLVFDIDNTLTMHGKEACPENIRFFEDLRKIGFSTCLLSNNKENRVKPFADAVKSSYICSAKKPRRLSYLRAAMINNCTIKENAFIGDQIFTDILGANLCGMESYLVKPVNPKEEIQIVIKRYFEKIILYFYKKKYKALNLALFGKPVLHSLSPLLHGIIAEFFGHKIEYKLIETDNVNDCINNLKGFDLSGANVTMPIKREFINKLTAYDNSAVETGSVNTLVKYKSGYKGFNTDISGILYSLKKDGIKIRNKNVIIIGAGGAARAVFKVCCDEGASSITIFNRNIRNAEKMVSEIKSGIKDIFVYPLCEEIFGKEKINEVLPYNDYIAFQCTSIGMGNSSEVPVESESFYEKIYFGTDLIYKPYVTGFMKRLYERNKLCKNGYDMLIYQGIASYELWSKKRIKPETREVLAECIRKKIINKPKILVINGPNLNFLGIRNKEIYGDISYNELCNMLYDKYSSKVKIECFQSNSEGEIISKLHSEIENNIVGLVLNLGAYTHYSYAIKDAVDIYKYVHKCRILEVHLSNIYEREDFRHTNVLKDLVDSSYIGLGIEGYFKAIDEILIYL